MEKKPVHKLSIPFYIIGIIFLVVAAFSLLDYGIDFYRIIGFKKNFVKIPGGATVKHVTSDIKNYNIFNGFPLLNLVGDIFLPGTTTVILVEYEYYLHGVKYIARGYDLLNIGFRDKLDAVMKMDKLKAGNVDLYIDPKTNRSYLSLNKLSDLGLPWETIIYTLIGLFMFYGGYLLPNIFNEFPKKIDAYFTKKFGIIPFDLVKTI